MGIIRAWGLWGVSHKQDAGWGIKSFLFLLKQHPITGLLLWHESYRHQGLPGPDARFCLLTGMHVLS